MATRFEQSYAPLPPPQDATPGEVLRYLQEELRRISSVLAQLSRSEIPALTVAPEKPREGMLVLAKAPWDPGSGAGLYIFVSGAWVLV
jgi:hypothetical protein